MTQTRASPRRVEGRAKVSGGARYAGDTPAEGVLFGALVEATIAAGTVEGIDAAAARASAGFAALVSAEQGAALKPVPALEIARETTVHFPGQGVALVVAETRLQARDAADRVRVAYAEAPAITSIDSPLAQPYAPDLCGARAKAASLRGDPAAGAGDGGGRGARALHDGGQQSPSARAARGGVLVGRRRLEVHTSTQAVFGTRAVIAAALDIPRDRVRVVTRFLGGGFGCKGQLWFPYLLWTILAARETGRPVRLELTRSQMFSLVGRRAETVQDVELGAGRDGRLTAIRHHVLAQTSHAEYSDRTAVISRQLYACANVETGHRLVRTNGAAADPHARAGRVAGEFRAGERHGRTRGVPRHRSGRAAPAQLSGGRSGLRQAVVVQQLAGMLEGGGGAVRLVGAARPRLERGRPAHRLGRRRGDVSRQPSGGAGAGAA